MTLPLVLHAITELNYGGAEQLLVNMLDNLAQSTDSAFRHQVVTLYDGDTALGRHIQALGIPVTDLQMKDNGRFSAPLQFWRLLRQEKPTIIHNWLYHASLFGRVLGRLAGVPVITTARHSVYLGSPLRNRLHQLTGRLDDRTILICDFMRTQESGAPNRYEIIYNGIPALQFPPKEEARIGLRAELGLPVDTLIVLTTGRLHAVKGHADLISVVAQLVKTWSQLHFVWAGDGEERPLLTSQIANNNLGEHIHLLGNRADVAYLLSASDLFVMPSRWEGVSMAILEAMAASLPVIATAVGGTPELVIHNETGLLVPPRDSSALAQAISHLLDHPEAAAQMGRNGRQRVAEQFTIERMVVQTETLYERLLREKGLSV